MKKEPKKAESKKKDRLEKVGATREIQSRWTGWSVPWSKRQHEASMHEVSPPSEHEKLDAKKKDHRHEAADDITITLPSDGGGSDEHFEQVKSDKHISNAAEGDEVIMVCQQVHELKSIKEPFPSSLLGEHWTTSSDASINIDDEFQKWAERKKELERNEKAQVEAERKIFEIEKAKVKQDMANDRDKRLSEKKTQIAEEIQKEKNKNNLSKRLLASRVAKEESQNILYADIKHEVPEAEANNRKILQFERTKVLQEKEEERRKRLQKLEMEMNEKIRKEKKPTMLERLENEKQISDAECKQAFEFQQARIREEMEYDRAKRLQEIENEMTEVMKKEKEKSNKKLQLIQAKISQEKSESKRELAEFIREQELKEKEAQKIFQKEEHEANERLRKKKMQQDKNFEEKKKKIIEASKEQEAELQKQQEERAILEMIEEDEMKLQALMELAEERKKATETIELYRKEEREKARVKVEEIYRCTRENLKHN